MVDALNILLTEDHLFNMVAISCSAAIHHESGCYTAKHYGHSKILGEVLRELLAFPTNGDMQTEPQEEFYYGTCNYRTMGGPQPVESEREYSRR